LDEDRKELDIKIMKIITKTNENVAVKHEENVRTQNPKPLLSVNITGKVVTPEVLQFAINI